MLKTFIPKRGLASNATMQAWVSERGAGIELKTVPVPVLNDPSHVLLKVKASSVNPIDVAMSQGYGREFLGTWKRLAALDLNKPHFPLIPGRDCTAIVESVGGNVHNLAPGDEVMAVVPVTMPGTHAEYVITEAKYCSKKPQSMTFENSAAMPYVASTAYSALKVALINQHNAKDHRILIHGGAGGVGSMAIQLLKAWGCQKIVSTCSKDSFELVSKLGAIPLDYSNENVKDQLIDNGPYEVVFDTVDSELAKWSDNVMGIWRNSMHVSIVSPLLREMDSNGVVLGLFSTAMHYMRRTCESNLKGRWFSYAFFTPSSDLMLQLSNFGEQGKIKPVVEKVVKFEEMVQAYEKVSRLDGKGKTVVKYD